MNSPDFQGSIGSKYKWFIGQIPPGQNQMVGGADWKTAWGNRVRVRIPAIHSRLGANTPDDKLPWAIIAKPTSQGYLNGGSTAIIGGEWVIGFWLDSDSMNPQIPVITAIFDVNYEDSGIKQGNNRSTEFKKVDRYWMFEPADYQKIGGTTPTTQAKPSSDAFNSAKTPETPPGIIPEVSWREVGNNISLSELESIRNSGAPWITPSVISDAETDAIRLGVITEEQRTI